MPFEMYIYTAIHVHHYNTYFLKGKEKGLGKEGK